jgi:hypothetical protein
VREWFPSETCSYLEPARVYHPRHIDSQNHALMPLQFLRRAISEVHSCRFHPMMRFAETRPLRLHSRPFLWVALGTRCGRRWRRSRGRTRRVTRVTVASSDHYRRLIPQLFTAFTHPLRCPQLHPPPPLWLRRTPTSLRAQQFRLRQLQMLRCVSPPWAIRGDLIVAGFGL